MEAAFEEYQPLLWQVWAKLTRDGYAAPPGEARDIIHDFYLDDWAGLARRYDPAKGSFRRYVFQAFYYFARRRALAWQRHRPVRLLRELAGRGEPGPADAEDAADRERLLAAVRRAVESLDPDPREVLRDFLVRGGSERELAARHRVTRHRLREELGDAVGRVATAVGGAGGPDTRAGRVAAALWVEGRSVTDAARLLGLTPAEVQAARRGFIDGILDHLRGLPPSPPPDGGDAMTEKPLPFLKTVLLSPAPPPAAGTLAEVRRRAAEIREALEDGEIEFTDEETRRLDDRLDWVAAVYDALSGLEDSAGDEANPIADAIRELRARTDVEVAEAFRGAVENLPGVFSKWPAVFAGVPAVNPEFQEYLAGLPVVRRAGRRAAELVPYGLTPAVFVEAARGLELLCDRILSEADPDGGVVDDDDHDDGPAPPPPPTPAADPELADLCGWLREQARHRRPPQLLVVAPGVKRPFPSLPVVPPGLLLAQVRATPQCPPEAAGQLLRWLIEAARLRPLLVPGYEAADVALGAVQLTPAPAAQRFDLVRRWTLAARPRLEPAGAY